MPFAINHVSLVVSSMENAHNFYTKVLGLQQHHDVEGWYILVPDQVLLHLIEIDETKRPDGSEWHHYYRHVALEVPSLANVTAKALAAGFQAFQMDDSGNEAQVESSDASLDFGLKTLFVRDPDGNLWEFVEKGFSWGALWGEPR